MKKLLTPTIKEIINEPKFGWTVIIMCLTGSLLSEGAGFVVFRLIHFQELRLGYLCCVVIPFIVIPAVVFRIFALSIELTKAKDDLSRSNRELEQYAYVVSHDLQEPLRMVSSFCQKLEENYRDSFDNNAREYMRQAAEGASRMQALIKDLLSRARAKKEETKPKASDLKHVLLNPTVRQVIKDPKFWWDLLKTTIFGIFVSVASGSVIIPLIHLKEIQLGYLCCVIIPLLVVPINTVYIQILSFELIKTKDDLSRSNKELEQYAYVVSHDLQEPLRTVSSFCQELDENYGDRLDDNAKEYIHYAVDGANRMQEMIKGLLSFARIEDKRAMEIKEVDLNHVVQTILHDLELIIKEKKATIKVDQLPVIMANEVQMRQLFQNFMTNALKFKGERDPVVEVLAQKTGKEWQFTVSDNGIGIDEQHFAQIFVMFQRLHSRNEYPGTGIGLAMCKKIVENFGGKVWVKSKVGQGTSFSFTLNVQEIRPVVLRKNEELVDSHR